MSQIEVGPVFRQSDAGKTRIGAVVTTPDFTTELWFRAPEHILPDPSGNPFLATCLLPAMKLGLPLRIRGTVSGRLLQSVGTIQEIFHKWYPELAIIPVMADDVDDSALPRSTQSAAFFSGGLDSFHSVLKNHSRIDHLIFVHGFDIKLENTGLRDAVSGRVRQAAQALGKPLVEIETNIREIGDHYLSWTMHFFGPALASVGLLLGKSLGRIFIPASESYAHLEPCASHPLVDPLWSTENVDIIHDGAEASRNEKAAYIADSPAAMNALRVCWENPHNAYNCGHCEKCLRTMINLESAGALERCTTFGSRLDPVTVVNMDIGNDLVLFHVEENLRVLEASSRNPAVVDALRTSISAYKAAQLDALFREAQNDPAIAAVFSQLISRRKERAFKALWQACPNWVAKEVAKESIKRFLGKKG
ncbi:MAG: RING finger protein [Thiobacillus sp.]